MKNAIGIEIPSKIEGIGELIPFQGEWAIISKIQPGKLLTPRHLRVHDKNHKKLCANIDECLNKLNLFDGMTISFHHHMRAGDATVLPIITKLAERGIKNITLAASSLTNAHEPLVPFVEKGIITKIWTSGLRGKMGKAISSGLLATPVIFHSHGGRARAVESGELKIDVAFLAASAADAEGNATGCWGPSACGSMGYAVPDSEYARQVVVLTDNLVPYPCWPASLIQQNIDYVVPLEGNIGDPKKIAGDSTRITKNPMDLRIAELATKAIDRCGIIQPGYSLQAGAGGASLAVARYIREIQKERQIKGSFILGGVTAVMTSMLEEGLFGQIFDVQSFDSDVSKSIFNNPRHVEISASQYANPFNCGCMTHKLDLVILAALEVDVNFNVNVLVGSDGNVMGASGGHCDTAAGAKLTVVVAPTLRGRLPIVQKQICSITTPGSSVDMLVTERGICINPARKDLLDSLKGSGLPVRDINELCAEAEKMCGTPIPPQFEDKIVGLVQYRDGSILDVIRQVKKNK